MQNPLQLRPHLVTKPSRWRRSPADTSSLTRDVRLAKVASGCTLGRALKTKPLVVGFAEASTTEKTSASSRLLANDRVSQVLAQGEEDVVKEVIHLQLQMLSLLQQLEAKRVQQQ